MEYVDMDFNGMDVSKIDVNLKHLYYFIVVAETGNITRAAQKLYVTQPMLSKNMMALENIVGTSLFDRQGKYFTLTKIGRYLYMHWKTLINDYRNDMVQAGLMQHTKVDQLRIGCFPVLDTFNFLQPYTDLLYKKYPDIFVEMYRMNYIRLLEYLHARQLDLMITLADDLPENRDIYEWKELQRVPLVAVMSSDHPLAGAERLRLSMLKGNTLLLNDPDGNLSRMNGIHRMLKRNGLEDVFLQYVNNDLTAYLSAAQGKGIAIGIRALYPEKNSGVRIIDLVGVEKTIVGVWNWDAAQEVKDIINEFLA